MPQVLVHNQLSQAITVFDSYAPKNPDSDSNSNADSGSSGKTNYYGTLTSLGSIPANGSQSITLKHNYSDVVIAFGSDNQPIARYEWNTLDQATPPDFCVTSNDVSEIKLSEQFVLALANNPSGSLATSFRKVVKKGPKSVDQYFKSHAPYQSCTFESYMLALTYEAQNPPSKASPPSAPKHYSLKMLIEAITGLPYPSLLPDILVRDFFCRYVAGELKFGCIVDIDALPFCSGAAKTAALGWLAKTSVFVEIEFDTNLSADIFGTKIIFITSDFHIPIGGGKTLTLAKPSVEIDITPLFKFVVFTARASLPFTIFNKSFEADLSITLDNNEAAVGAVIKGDNASLPAPPVLKGVHLDEFGVSMGIIFDPPGFALGLEGKFHIGSGSNVVALDDDTFAIICEIEEEVPNPVYLSFYVPRLDVSTLVAVFTNCNIDFGIPVSFENLSFVWCENLMEPFVLPDGSLCQNEFAFSAYMHILGLKFYGRLKLDLNGVEGKAQISPISIGNVLKITGDSKALTAKFDAAGNMIKNNFVPNTAAKKAIIDHATTRTIVPAGGPEISVSTSSSPYLTLDASVSLLDVEDESISARIDSNGAHFELDYGGILHGNLMVNLQDSGKLTGSFSYGPDFYVHLSAFGISLGSIHITAVIHAMMKLTVDSQYADFSVQGGLNVEGLDIEFGPFEVDVNISGMTHLLSTIEQYIQSHVKQLFSELLNDAKKWAQWVKNEIISGVNDLVHGLRYGFQLAYQAAADVLHDIGYAAEFIAQGLRDIYNIGSEVVADVLKGLGYAGDAISDALKYAGFGLDEVVKGLKYVGYAAEDVARWVSGVFGDIPGAINSAMQAAGYAVDDIENAFKAIGGAFADFAEKVWNTITHDLNPSNW